MLIGLKILSFFPEITNDDSSISWEIIYASGIITVTVLASLSTESVISELSSVAVITPSYDMVNDFLLSLNGVGSTIINVSGGQSNDKQTLILAVAPTKMYFVIKEGLKEIDKNIFYLVCDSYEVSSRDDK